jgi:hypothetical protein
MRKRIQTALAGGLLIVGLTGCYEKFDDNVMFQNNTDQDLLVIARTAKDKLRRCSGHMRQPRSRCSRRTCARRNG